MKFSWRKVKEKIKPLVNAGQKEPALRGSWGRNASLQDN
jgi:hypothetical protein